MGTTHAPGPRSKPIFPTFLILLAVLAIVAAIELAMGRLPLGPDHKFALWESDIWSNENSQRLADPYSFSHIVHGILFYAILHQIIRFLLRNSAPKPRQFSSSSQLKTENLKLKTSSNSALSALINNPFVIALVIEATWELLENSPLIINRYRAVTISLGYVGDSVLNSCSDILMMCLGYLLAARIPVWASVAAVLAMEIGCLLWVRDNLTLNVIMLIHPLEAIKHWQSAGHPLP